ncbi:MAG: sulfite exporter TauE/SafE family protein, partial [Methylococcales bacterium]|nr:sulfite exporter TauE/SafE family protein [Methylococcales bacterium]
MIFYCLVLGVFAGLLAGLFGIGGGVAIVPSLLALFAWQGFPADSVMVIAIATSLATVVLTSIASMQAHRRMGTIEW